jgi:hypothetical protein
MEIPEICPHARTLARESQARRGIFGTERNGKMPYYGAGARSMGNAGRWHFVRELVGFLSIAVVATSANAIEVKTIDNQMIVSGSIVKGDGWTFKSAISSNPRVDTVVFRNMPGGLVEEMEVMRSSVTSHKLNTVVSGYCNSACATAFMAGEKRNFAADGPAEYAYLGFHSWYASQGSLKGFATNSIPTNEDLWYVKRSGGKLSRELVQRWMTLGQSGGMAKFFGTPSAGVRTMPSYICETARPIEQCEKLDKSALELGLITSTDLVPVNDQKFPAGDPPFWQVSQYEKAAPISKVFDVKRLSAAQKNFMNEYIKKELPKAIALTADGKSFQSAWHRDGAVMAIFNAVTTCQTRTNSKCRVIAIDGDLVASTEEIEANDFKPHTPELASGR